MINERELVKSKKTFMNMFYGFMYELSTTGEIDLEQFAKCLKGLRDIISIQTENFKSKEIQSVLRNEMKYIKGIASLVMDYKRNKKTIISIVSSLSKEYEKEKRILNS